MYRVLTRLSGKLASRLLTGGHDDLILLAVCLRQTNALSLGHGYRRFKQVIR